jgi:hypothetical protein
MISALPTEAEDCEKDEAQEREPPPAARKTRRQQHETENADQN